MKIKGLIFDLDGIITDTAQLHFLAWKQSLLVENIDFSETENAQLKGLSRKETLKAILELKKLTWDEQKIDTVCFKKNEIYLKLLENLNKDHLLPGILDLLTSAKAKKLKIGLASSSLNAPLILEKLGIIAFFDYIADPKKIKKPKPAPDIFLLASEGLSLNPENCIGFEDSLSGFLSIKSAKMRSVVVSLDQFSEFNQADFWFSSTDQLKIDHILTVLNS
ncbi:beta-phosphoglucomutase [Mesomycoplasma ovipneumoniae]|uniref:beta-phosphoglucomutase n=1 Tax=Mesomycoplasma ovipneumoniae TaxID=29562 RepID=UPI0024AD4CFF|nr:beta-phosphoglucomutase [Mesomycoplasma ovipneumoniae]WHF53187.1 beta-phosphoglucomutase [Mesomycoplasma ovipneumoniae]